MVVGLALVVGRWSWTTIPTEVVVVVDLCVPSAYGIIKLGMIYVGHIMPTATISSMKTVSPNGYYGITNVPVVDEITWR